MVYFFCFNSVINTSTTGDCLNLYSFGLLKKARHFDPNVGLIILSNTACKFFGIVFSLNEVSIFVVFPLL